MAGFLVFDEGANELFDHGYPPTVFLALSRKRVGSQELGEHRLTDTLAGGFGEINGSSYGRKPVRVAAAVARAVTFEEAIWNVGEATDWPDDVRSVVATTSTDELGRLLWAMNLAVGGVARDMSLLGSEQRVTPTHRWGTPA